MAILLILLVFLHFLVLGSYPRYSLLWISGPLILILLLFFSAMSVYYFLNCRLFSLLENENWPALIRYLEDRILQKGGYSSRLVRLLANCYLVLSDSAAVISLENNVAIAKPDLVEANALIFGTARVLGKDIFGAMRFFESRRETARPEIKDWIRWYHGLTLLLAFQYEKAGEEFSFLAGIANDRKSDGPVIAALSSYFLSQILSPFLPLKRPEYREISSSGRERVLKALPGLKNWNREISRLSAEIHAAAISKYMEETMNWLYGGKSL